MSDATETWCARVRTRCRESRLLVISGKFGLGKTCCLRAARSYVNAIYMDVWPALWPKPISTASIEWPQFIYEVTENGNREHWEDVIHSDVVFIDDLGAEEDRYRSGAPVRVLGDLLGQLENAYVFLTTNIRPDAWVERWDGRVNDRLFRRNAALCNLYDPAYAAQSYAQWQLHQ